MTATLTEARLRAAHIPRVYWDKTKTLENLGDGGKRLLEYLKAELEGNLLVGNALHLYGDGKQQLHVLPMVARALVILGKRVYYANAGYWVQQITEQPAYFLDAIDNTTIFCVDDINDLTDAKVRYSDEQVWRVETFFREHLDLGWAIFTAGSKPLMESKRWTASFLATLNHRQNTFEIT